jgi:hypothetical protein
VRGFDGDLGRFEVFLFTAIGMVLVTRGYLSVAGYPRVGSGELHIAHVLWGGLLLGLATVMMLVGLGSRIRWWAALVSGVGFGLFIDEVGKFLTQDADYLYPPAIAVMYLLFAVSYLVVLTMLTHRGMSDTRRLALAGHAVTDQALGRLTAERRTGAVDLLDHLAVPSASAEAIRGSLLAGPVDSGRFELWLSTVRYRAQRVIDGVVSATFVQVTAYVLLVLWTIVSMSAYLTVLLLVIAGEESGDFLGLLLLATSLAAGFAITGGLILIPARRQRRLGLHLMQLGVLIDLLFNEFSTFRDQQFGALTLFIPELLMLLAVRRLLRHNDFGPPEVVMTADHDETAVLTAAAR